MKDEMIRTRFFVAGGYKIDPCMSKKICRMMLWNKIDLMDLKILPEGRSDSKTVMEA